MTTDWLLMPFAAVELHGTWTSAVEADEGRRYDKTEAGFDSVTIPYWLYVGGNAPETFADSTWPSGTLLSGFSQMYVSDVAFQREGVNIYKYHVTARGLLGIKAVKRIISSKGATYELDVGTGGGHTDSQFQGGYSILTATFLQVTNELPTSVTSDVKKQSPALLFDMPPTPTNSIPTYASGTRFFHPDGWVLDGVEIEEIAGAEIYFIRRDYAYYPTTGVPA